MKKLLTGVLLAAVLSTATATVHASDVVVGVIGGIILGTIITDNHHHKNRSAVVTPPDIYVVQPSVTVHPNVMIMPPVVEYRLCTRTVYVRPQ